MSAEGGLDVDEFYIPLCLEVFLPGEHFS